MALGSDTTSDLTITSNIVNIGSILKSGAGRLTLSGTNAYLGTTTISGGTLSASKIVVSGGNSSLGNAASAVTLGAASTEGTLSYTGNNATYTRGFTIGGAGGGRLDVTTSGQTLQVNTGNVTGSGLFTVGGAGNTTINSNLTHTGGLTKADAGTLTLAGTNTYTGTTTISAGTLSASNIVVSGGNSNLGNAASAVTLGAASTQGTLSYTGNNATYTRGFTIGGAGGGRLDVTTSGQTLQVNTGNVTGSGLFTVGGAGNTTINSNLTHTGGLTKADAGTLTLSAVNTFNGALTINGGTLALTAGNGLGEIFGSTQVNINNGSTLSFTNGGAVNIFTGKTYTFDAGGGGSILLGTGNYLANGSGSTFTTNGGARNNIGLITTSGTGFNLNGSLATFNVALGSDATSDLTVTPNIVNVGSILKSGAGRLTLTGNNTYSGTTTVSAGSLLVNNTVGSGTGTGAVTVASGAAIGGDGTIGNNLTLSTGAKFVFDLNNTPLTVSGTFALGAGFGVDDLVTSSLAAIDWSTVNQGTYTLIGTAFNFTSSNIDNFGLANAFVSGGKQIYFANGSLSLVVVPEPSTWALLAGVLSVAIIFHRRRRTA